MVIHAARSSPRPVCQFPGDHAATDAEPRTLAADRGGGLPRRVPAAQSRRHLAGAAERLGQGLQRRRVPRDRGLRRALCAPRGTERAAWGMLALGLFGFAAGDIYYTFALMGDRDPPYPSLADVRLSGLLSRAYVGPCCSCGRGHRGCRPGSGSMASSVRSRAPRSARHSCSTWSRAPKLVRDGRDQFAYPLGDPTCSRSSSPYGRRGARGRHDVAAARRWRSPVGRRGRDLPLPGGARHLPGVHDAGHGMAAARTADCPRGRPPGRAARRAPSGAGCSPIPRWPR